MAAGRLAAFVALWVAAFVFLPKFLVAFALIAWIVFITPKLRWLNREFQDASSVLQT